MEGRMGSSRGALRAPLPIIPLSTPGHEEAPPYLSRLLEILNPDFSLGRESAGFFKSLLPGISSPMSKKCLLVSTLYSSCCSLLESEHVPGIQLTPPHLIDEETGSMFTQLVSV